MLEAGNVCDDEGRKLTKDDTEVVEFLTSPEVKAVKEDFELFNYYFETTSNLDEWTKYYDEPTRKVKYKYEDGLTYVSCLCEGIIEAPLMNLVALFCEIDLFKDWFPNVTACDEIKQVTPNRGLYKCKQSMPWPMWPRDLTFTASGMLDHKNVGILTVIKSTDEKGGDYFGVPIPETAEGHVRIEIKRGYHYFQRIDDNTTRYVTIFNTDPQLQYAPGWFMNFLMTKICYQMLVTIQEEAKKVPFNEFGERMKRRVDFYGSI